MKPEERGNNLAHINTQFALRRLLKFVRRLRECQDATKQGAELAGIMQWTGAAIEGAVSALDQYEETLRITGAAPLEGEEE